MVNFLRFSCSIMVCIFISGIVLAQTSWKGTTNTSWAEPTNWTNGVPTSSVDAILGNASFTGANQPAVNNVGSCKSLTIGGTVTTTLTINKNLSVSGALLINSGNTVYENKASFSVNGNWTNNGTFTAAGTNSSVIFGGTSQTIGGSSSTAFRKLTINSGSSVTLASNISCSGAGAYIYVYGTLNPGESPTYQVTAAPTFNIYSTATLKVNAATIAGNYVPGVSLFAGCIVEYSSTTVNQTVDARTYSTLKISGNNIYNKTAGGNITLNNSSSTDGNVYITSGILDLSTYTCNRSTTGGGIFSISNGATLKIAGTNTFPANYTNNNLSLTSNTEYNGAAQTVAALTYGNLTLSSSSGNVTKTTSATAFTVAGNLVTSLGNGAGITLNAGTDITVSGNITIGASTTFNGSSYNHNIGGNWVNSGTFTGASSTVTMSGPGSIISGAGAQNFTNLSIAASYITCSSSTLNVAGNFATTGSGTFTHNAGNSISFTGSSKSISGTDIIFSDVNITGSISTTSTIGVTGNFAVSGTLSATGGRVTMSGSSKIISGGGTMGFYELMISGTVTTATNFSVNKTLDNIGTFSASAGTISFTGTSSLNGTVNLFNVTINGTSLLLSTDAMLGISNTFTITAGTMDVTTAIPNSVIFNGAGAQTVPAVTYNRLTFSGGNTKTALGNITTNGTFTIASTTTFAAGSFSHTLYSRFINSGSFTAGSSTMTFSGGNDVIMSGATTFFNLSINKSTSVNGVSLTNSVNADTVKMVNGFLKTDTAVLNITKTRTGNGIILGNIKRTHSFTTGVNYEFEGPENFINFSTVSSVTSVLVKVTAQSILDFPFGSSINRLYDISIPSGTYTATLRLHYEDIELNGNDETTMLDWANSGAGWLSIGKSANSSISNYIELSGITALSKKWTISGSPNVLRWNGSVDASWTNSSNWTVIQGTPGSVPTANDVVQIGQASITNQPTISTAVTVKNIEFGSVAVATLTIASGGSLITQGNIRGDWSSNATHTINAGAQNITVNGDLSLSDGTSGHALNINVSTGNIIVKGNISQSGNANIIFSSNGSLKVGKDFTYTSGTFTASTSTVYFDGTDAQVVGSVTYNNVNINKASGIASLAGATNINGDFTVSGGELYAQSALTIGGNLSINSGATLRSATVNVSLSGDLNNAGTFIPGSGTILFIGSGNQNISLATFNNITINKASGNTNFNGNIDVYGNFSILAGNIDLGTYTAHRTSSGGTFSLSAGATLTLAGASNFPNNYSANNLAAGSTILYNGTIAQTIKAVTYGNLLFSNGGSNAKTFSGTTTALNDITINSGATLAASNYSLNLSGNWVNNGTFNAGTGALILNGTNNTLSGNTAFNKVTVYGTYVVSALINNSYSGLIFIGPSGSLNGGTGVATISGDLTNNGTMISTGTTTFAGIAVQTIRLLSAIVSNANGIVNFNGTVSPVLNSTTSPTFATVNINNTGGVTASVGWTSLVAMNIGTGATFNGAGSTHNIYGAFTNNGTLTSSGIINFLPSIAKTYTLVGTGFSSTGTVVFGGSAAITVNGTPTALNDVTISNTAGVSPASNWSIGRNFTITNTGVFNASSYTYTVAGNTESDGTLNGGTSTFNLTSSAGQLSGSANTNFNHLIIADSIVAISDFNVTGNFTNNGKFDASIGTLRMTGSGASVIGGSATTYNLAQLDVNMSGSGTSTLARNVVSMANLDILSGTLDQSTYSITQDAGGGSLYIRNTATLKIGGTNTLPTFSTYALDTLSTVEYAGTTQSIFAATIYGNLTISAAGTKTPAAALTVLNNFSLTNGTFVGGSYTHTIKGGWNMSSGTFTNTGTTILFNGAANQDITSTGAFNAVTINKSAGYVNLLSDVTANGTLTFTLGKIYTNAFTLTVPTATISGAAQGTGWVYGNLKKTVATGAVTKTFESGGASNYTPVTVSFTNVSTSGSLTAKATGTDHAQLFTSGLDSAKSVNRYWTLTNSGIVFTNSGATASATVNWVATDVDAGSTTSSFMTGLYNGSSWSLTSFASPLSTSIQFTGLTGFGELAVGQRGAKVWTGASTNNWNLGANWTPSAVPVSTEDVLIPTGSIVYVNANVICNNITVSNPNVVVNISSGNTLTINGNLNLNNGILDINGQSLTLNGTFNGSAANSIRGSKTSSLIIGSSFANSGTSLFLDQNAATYNNYLKIFTVNKTVTLGNAINMAGADGAATGTVNIAAAATLNTSGFLTLKSDTTGTARIAALPVDGSGVATAFINGNVTVERFIPAKRTWRLLSVPLKSTGAPTINAAWQEGVTTASGTPNPNPGFGTHITGGTVANGFDQNATNAASIKYYSNNNLYGVPSTNVPITNYGAYFLFVRGDRSNNLSLGAAAPATNTVLRMKGQIATGHQPITIAAANYSLVGNPFPSAIDFGSLTKTNVSNVIYIWDPKLGGNFGVGGYVTGSWNAGTSSYVFTSAISPVSQYIPSGEAFFVASVDGTNPGTLTIKEADKSTSGSDQLFGHISMNGASVRVDLNSINASGSTTLADGLLAIYHDANSNEVNNEDAKKMNNSGENISLKREGKLLSIEQRKTFTSADTLFINSAQLKQQNYRMDISTDGMDATEITAVFKDKYSVLNNDKPLVTGGMSSIDFSVNADPASYEADRFSIVFMPAAVVPVKFASVAATIQQKNIHVSWKVENETNITRYEVQTSADAGSFTSATQVPVQAVQNNTYKWLDVNATAGLHYYRIKALENNGSIIYSNTVKINMSTVDNASVNIYPNIIEDNTIAVQISNIEKGNYNVEIFDPSGKLMHKEMLNYTGGAMVVNIAANNFAVGKYQLRISSAGKTYNATFLKR
ncbi:MAG: T9SS type A sorting domain-containing protein [Ferruginibacter sp.]